MTTTAPVHCSVCQLSGAPDESMALASCRIFAVRAYRHSVFFKALDGATHLAGEVAQLRADASAREREMLRLVDEVDRLTGLLEAHGIDPNPVQVVVIDTVLHTDACVCGARLIIRGAPGAELTDDDHDTIDDFADAHADCEYP